MMGKIFLNHLFGEFTRSNTKIPSSPKMSPPVPLFDNRKFFKNLLRHPALDSSHDIRRRDVWWCRNQNMHMIFADNTSQYLDFKSFASLSNQFSYSQRKISLQHLVTVLGYPYKMVLNFIFSMTALSIIHAYDYKPTASRMLPA